MSKETGMTARRLPFANNASSPPARPTMRDIARLAGGVHPSTVSLALRNHPGISEATRKRVSAAARKLGYRPDPLLDAFNTHRLQVQPHKAPAVIAFVADFDSRQSLEKSAQHAGIMIGARAAAEMLHCQIELFLIGKNQLPSERLHSILHARGIVGLVLLALSAPTNQLSFIWDDYSAVKIESLHLGVPLYTLSSDHRQAARVAVRQLFAAGYRDIGLATHRHEDSKQDDLHRAGFLLEQSRFSVRSSIPILELTDEDPSNTAVSWIHAHAVDAIVSDTVDLLSILEGAGLRAPEDIGFVGLDVTGNPHLSGIAPDHERVGAQAVEQVVGQMRVNQRGLPPAASCTYVPVGWQIGRSFRDNAVAPSRDTTSSPNFHANFNDQ